MHGVLLLARNESPPPERPSGDWRADMGSSARQEREPVLRHPWMAPLLGSRPPVGPNALRRVEFVLSVLDGLGLEPAVSVALLRALGAFFAGCAVLECS